MSDSRKPPRSRVRTLMGVQVLGTGSYVPERVVTNQELSETLGVDSDWVVKRTGILERRFAAPDQATSDLAIAAGRRCLEHAGVSPGDVDLLIVATWTPDVFGPSTASIVQNGLGIEAPSFDIVSGCAGFLYSMTTGMHYVASGGAERALIIGADLMSRVIDPNDRRGYPLFGDGAGAVLIGPGNDWQGMLAYTLGSDGSGADLLVRPMGGSRHPPSHELMDQGMHYLQMDGRPVFKWAVRLFTTMVPAVLSHVGMHLEQIDRFFLHQANLRILQSAAETLGIDEQRIAVNLDRYGNTAAGSVPLVLDEGCKQGVIQRGNNLLLGGFGAGLSWGVGILRW